MIATDEFQIGTRVRLRKEVRSSKGLSWIGPTWSGIIVKIAGPIVVKWDSTIAGEQAYSIPGECIEPVLFEVALPDAEHVYARMRLTDP